MGKSVAKHSNRFNSTKKSKPGKPAKSHTNKPHTLTIKSFFKPETTSLIDPSRIVALDCEMVEAIGNKDVLARVSIVSFSGKILLDLFVKQDLEIRDYRTDVTGVDAELLRKSGLPHSDVVARVSALLRDKVVVGHGLNNDFDVLEFSHTQVRDTAGYKPLRPAGREDKVPALRTLVALHLDGRVIQQGAHSSVEDARCALALYKKVMTNWETLLNKNRKSEQISDSLNRRLLRKARNDGVKRAATRKEKISNNKISLDQAIAAPTTLVAHST